MAESNQTEDSTSALLQRLFTTPDLEQFMAGNAADMALPSFHVYITEICQATVRVSEQVIKHAALERTYGHQLFNGTRNPSKARACASGPPPGHSSCWRPSPMPS